MKKILLFIVLLSILFCFYSAAQIKYGYAVLHCRCGNEDSRRNTVYFSPVIELDRLNFEKYTAGVDASFPKFSVRYYNYAIAKWFEIFLNENYKIAINDPEKYERNLISVVYNSHPGLDCNDDKTNMGCFFTDKQKLINLRNAAILENKLPKHETEFCKVIDL